MSHAAEPSTVPDDELQPANDTGHVVGQKKTLEEYANLDAEDEALNKWKASLGIVPGATAAPHDVKVLTLSLVADSRSGGPLVLDLTDATKLADLKKNPITIKEGADYALELKFNISGSIVTGLRYIQAVRRAGITVDKSDIMIGSFGPTPEPVVKRFDSDTAPSGMIARSGTYSVRSRIQDDDKVIYSDFEWCFQLKKEW